MTQSIRVSDTFTNPILPGSYPDPSICRAGDDYYLVNSSFEYFPGLPLHHSRDLVNWELVGYGLHREAQCAGRNNLVDVQTKGGIHAPTLRHHNGRFYIITTNVYLPPGDNQATQFVNFIITADDIAGPWSQPHIIAGAPGIDPDIFFDDDGRVWYVGTHAPENPNFNGEGEIWLQELDPDGWRLVGQRHYLWRGACGGVWVEGPHLYKHDGRYYLLVAEGGTSFNHAVMVAVSDTVTGPYTSNPRNPILTSRHLSYDHWVHSTGHADLVTLPDGRTYMVALGVRGDERRGSNMGRETHLIPVSWEREPFAWKAVKHDWPVCAPDNGRVLRHTPLPFPTAPQQPHRHFHDHFDAETLDLAWNFRRLPLPGVFSLTARPGRLRLFARPEVIRERGRAAWLGFRQTESDFHYSAGMAFTAVDHGIEAGLCLLQEDNNYLTMTIGRMENEVMLRLALTAEGQTRDLARRPLSGYHGQIVLRVVAQNHRYRYAYSLDDGGTFQLLAKTGADLILSHGYTGAYLGLYATSHGRPTTAFADFDWVQYESFPRKD